MRYQWQRKLDIEILLHRRPDEGDREEIKSIEIGLRGKEECRATQMGADTSKISAMKSHRHREHPLKLIRTQSACKKKHKTPNRRFPQHLKN